MKKLVSTFGQGDFEKTMEAMRRLPYEQLVLIGEGGMKECGDYQRILAFEELSGHDVEAEILDEGGFMETVEQVSSLLEKHSRGTSGDRAGIILNISGGSKLLGDAALFAAFRVGVRACHCEGRMTMLPVVSGATATDRFTPSQAKFMRALGSELAPLDRIIEKAGASSRQAAERIIRELRKLELLETDVVDGRIYIGLSDAGAEVSRALRRSSAL